MDLGLGVLRARSVFCATLGCPGSGEEVGADDSGEVGEEFAAAADVGALEERAFVGVDGVFAEAEFVGDLFAGLAAADAVEDFALALGEGVDANGVLAVPKVGELLVAPVAA